MSIRVIDTIKPNGVPLGQSQFPTVEDIDTLGGFQVQATDTTRNAIPVANRKQGMLVYVIADTEFYQLQADLVTWVPANFGTSVTLGGDVTGTSGSNTVVQLTGSGGIVTALARLVTRGRRLAVTAVTANYPVVSTDEIIAVGVISSPITVTLPSTPTNGDTYTVKDAAGSATAHNISVSGNGHNIDGSSSPVILYTNYQTVQLVYNNALTQWNIV